MEISHIQENETCVIAIEGILGFADLEAFEAAVNSAVTARRKEIILDFHKVDYIDSSAIGMLVRLTREADSAGSALRFKHVREGIMRILRITGVDSVLDIIDSEAKSLCRSCMHYIPLGDAYGNCQRSRMSGYDLVVQADSSCDHYESAQNPE